MTPLLKPGDRVRLTPRYSGTISRLIGDQAEVVEEEMLGRRTVWRVALAALARLPESQS